MISRFSLLWSGEGSRLSGGDGPELGTPDDFIQVVSVDDIGVAMWKAMEAKGA